MRFLLRNEQLKPMPNFIGIFQEILSDSYNFMIINNTPPQSFQYLMSDHFISEPISIYFGLSDR